MIESIHLAGAIDVYHGLGWEQHVFGSTAAGTCHPALHDVTIHAPRPLANHVPPSVRVAVRSPLAALRSEALRRLPRLRRLLGLGLPFGGGLRDPGAAARLAEVVDRVAPDLVVSHELQHAAYLTQEARALLRSFPRWAVSNWGSDIALYRRLPDHRARLEAVLSAADDFHAECERDVAYARALGFRGRVLPVTPIAGGYDVERSQTLRAPGPTSARRTILLKGYQHWAGRSLVALRALARDPALLTGRRLVVYSASPDVQLAARLLAAETRVELELPGQLPHDDMLRLHGQARVSIGLSIGDGISQSFLEALLMGSFPVQSSTACACEWAQDGETAILVPPEEPEQVAHGLRRALTDDALVDAAARRNLETARRRLGRSTIRARLQAALRGPGAPC
jgi:glycosyltransferase involved in cell wall biosynthesis